VKQPGEILTPNSLREMTANNALRAGDKMDVRRAALAGRNDLRLILCSRRQQHNVMQRPSRLRVASFIVVYSCIMITALMSSVLPAKWQTAII